MSDPRPDIVAGGPITPEALEAVAAWLDTHDRLAAWLLERMAATEGNPPDLVESIRHALGPLGSTDVQDDLRRWAADLRAALVSPDAPSAAEVRDIIARFIATEVGYESPGMAAQADDLIAVLAAEGWAFRRVLPGVPR